MKTKLNILIISSSFLILLSLAIIGFTYGWFVHDTSFPDNTVSVGDLRYVKTGALVDEASVIVPGENLVVTAFSVDNLSPIASQLRMKITYTRVTSVLGVPTPEANYVYKGATDDHLGVTFTSTFTLTDGDPTPDEYDDDYWYYLSATDVISAASGVIPLISEIYYDGAKTSIDYQGQPVSIRIVMEVKQAGSVSWAELATYDFSTGYPVT